MQEEVDDKLMDRDTSGMDEVTKGYFELRKKHAMERLLAVDVELDKGEDNCHITSGHTHSHTHSHTDSHTNIHTHSYTNNYNHSYTHRS